MITVFVNEVVETSSRGRETQFFAGYFELDVGERKVSELPIDSAQASADSPSFVLVVNPPLAITVKTSINLAMFLTTV